MKNQMNSKIKYLGWCPDIAKRLGMERNCCDSCHEDEDYGYSLSNIEFKDGYYDVCCKMKEAITLSS